MYSKREEFYNVITHGLGIILAIIAFIILLLFDHEKSPYSKLGIALYTFSMLFLYLASTLYHAISHLKWKRILRKMDHIGIYLLIAGTYTPVTLISLVNRNGWLLFVIVWGIALLGTVLKIFFTGKYEKISLLLYLAMGWLIIFDIKNVIELQSSLGLTFLALGGLFYTFGTIFYAMEKIPYNHAIWHCFVLGGSVSHFLFIFLDVI
jgi:hemolysin III